MDSVIMDSVSDIMPESIVLSYEMIALSDIMPKWVS
jgi:hypothetical protein